MSDKKGAAGHSALKLVFQFSAMLFLIGADRVIKLIVEENLPSGEAVQVIPGFFCILHIRNTGAAFSMFSGARVFLILLPAVLILAALIYLVKYRDTISPLLSTSLILISAGGISNMIDRIASGAVTDYLSFGSFAIFNFADVCVCTGCGLLILWIILTWMKEKEE